MRPCVLVLLILLSGAGRSQSIPQLTPFSRTGDLYVTDAGNDAVYRLQDMNLDGDYNDAGEVIEFYNDVAGTFELTNNAGVAVGPEGTVYLSDTSKDFILALRDLDGDGAATGTGESWIFFDGNPANNGSGIAMRTPQDVTVDGSGVVWVANAGSSAGGVDAIIRLEDLGGAPGANDPGEASLYYTPTPNVSIGDSIPADVKIGPGGFVYYAEVGATGVFTKGIYRLHDDVVPNGHCNDPGEVTPYYIPSPLSGNPFYWGFAFDGADVLYVADVGNDVVWRAEDLDGDLSIASGTFEESLYWTAGVSSQNWMVAADSQISIFTAESQSPDRILRMSDSTIPNGNVNDPGEVVAVYDETQSPVNISNPRSIAFARRPTLSAPSMVGIGTTGSLEYLGAQGDPLEVYYSLAPANQPLPPFGTLGLALLPSPSFGPLYSAVLPSSGVHQLLFPIPNDPALIGAVFYLQGFSGRSRVEFSNPQMVTLF